MINASLETKIRKSLSRETRENEGLEFWDSEGPNGPCLSKKGLRFNYTTPCESQALSGSGPGSLCERLRLSLEEAQALAGRGSSSLSERLRLSGKGSGSLWERLKFPRGEAQALSGKDPGALLETLRLYFWSGSGSLWERLKLSLGAALLGINKNLAN